MTEKGISMTPHRCSHLEVEPMAVSSTEDGVGVPSATSTQSCQMKTSAIVSSRTKSQSNQTKTMPVDRRLK